MANPWESFAVPQFGFPQNGFRSMVEAMESQAASAMEQFVAGEGFTTVMLRFTENLVAVTKLSADFWDMVLRQFRLAGIGDVDRLARQLERNEDKLELLLQAVERMEAASVHE